MMMRLFFRYLTFGETGASSTSSPPDLAELTQQPAKPGDKRKVEHDLDDIEELQDTLNWVDRFGTRRPHTTKMIRTAWNENTEGRQTTGQFKQRSSSWHSLTLNSLMNSEDKRHTGAPSPGVFLTTRKQDWSTEEQRTSPQTVEETILPPTDTKASLRPRQADPSSAQSQVSSITRDYVTEDQRTSNTATDSYLVQASGNSPETHQIHDVTISSVLTTLSTEIPSEHDKKLTQTATYTPAPSENACRLPKLNPWDPSIKHLLQDVGEDPGCNHQYPLPMFDVISNKLVTKTGADRIDFQTVKVETIHRNNGDDNDFHYLDKGNPFNVSAGKNQISDSINSSDLFRLEYKVRDEAERHVYFFARVVPQLDVIERAQKIRQQFKQQLDLNVLMIGFDSVSRANFLRKMPNSLAFLRKEMESFFYQGYSIIGDATTPALTALLTGNHVTELPEGRRGWDNSRPIDDWPWIMKKYENSGYVTLFAEDDSSMGAFNLRLLGFDNPPTHHYLRPFWLAIERAGARDETGVCSKSNSLVNYTLDYLCSFYEAYPKNPKFAFSFMSYISHAHPNQLSYADKDLLRLLKTFVRRRYHENTIFILFGDHGSRNDDVRNTMQGKLEERLPWLSISVPKWLRDKSPDMLKALAHNQHVISSPFDVHATLHHVLTYPSPPADEKTQSLFTELSTGRTCLDAGKALKPLAKRIRKSTQVFDLRSTCISFGTHLR